MLLLDGVFFLLARLHPSEQGLWLSTVAYFYVLTFSALLIRVVARMRRSLRCPSVFFAVFRPMPSMWLWPAVVLGGVLAVVLALHKH